MTRRRFYPSGITENGRVSGGEHVLTFSLRYSMVCEKLLHIWCIGYIAIAMQAHASVDSDGAVK